MQLLAAADTIAASSRREMRPRRWHDPTLWVVIVAFACLVLLSAAFAQLSFVAASNRSLLSHQLAQTSQLHDCIDPNGRCYQQGQQRTAAAVIELQQRISVGMCRLAYPHASAAAIKRCVVLITQP